MSLCSARGPGCWGTPALFKSLAGRDSSLGLGSSRQGSVLVGSPAPMGERSPWKCQSGGIMSKKWALEAGLLPL